LSKLHWQSSALRDLKRADPKVRERIVVAIERLARSGQGDVKLLQGKTPREYRLRVSSWRVRFARDDENSLLIILHVFQRGHGYH
jgi:mRNA-degrading endonuclease RelE of RelBE toxin-antitoxin system